MRAIWKGSLSFGLVNIPVHLYVASHEKELSFVLLHNKDHSRIRYAKICVKEDKEVPWDEIVKGYEYEKGDYVVLQDEDFEKANLKKTKTIELMNFIDESEIDTFYYVKPYFLEPDKNAVKAYNLLHDALKITQKVGLAKFVLHNREHLAVVKVHENMLVLNELRYQNEIVNPKELTIPASEKTKTQKKELDMAILLIDQLTIPFEPKAYKDTYIEELKQIIKKKPKENRSIPNRRRLNRQKYRVLCRSSKRVWGRKRKRVQKNPVRWLKAMKTTFISPMLATLIKSPFNHEEWLFETKWDGYRVLVFIDDGKVQLKSRSDHLLNAKFPLIVDELKKMDHQVILDGEVVILDEKGKSNFQCMQNYQATGEGDLYYYVFDILYADGVDLRKVPLIERKELLRKYLKRYRFASIRFSDYVLYDGEALFQKALEQNWEGIIGKKITSPYQSKRSRYWVKIKTKMRQEVVIGGFTEPRGSRKYFGALLVGVYNDEGELIYAGHTGGGFNEARLRQVYDQLVPLRQEKCPFKNRPKPNAPVTWVKPKLVCEVAFAEWTKDQVMRQPIFEGLRTDKKPRSITREIPLISEK